MDMNQNPENNNMVPPVPENNMVPPVPETPVTPVETPVAPVVETPVTPVVETPVVESPAPALGNAPEALITPNPEANTIETAQEPIPATQPEATAEALMTPNPAATDVQPLGSGAITPNEPKKNNKTLIIIIAVLAVVLVVVLVVVFTGDKKPSSDPSKDKENQIKEELKIEDKIKLNTQKLENQFLVTAKNENNKVVMVEVTVNLYDKDDKLIDTTDSYVGPIEPNSTIYDSIYYDEDKKYERYEVKFKAEATPYYVPVDKSKLKVTENVVEDEMLIQIKNETGALVEDLKAVVIFKKGEEIIAYRYTSFFDVREDATESDKIYLPHDKNYDVIKYDGYEIFVTGYNTNFDVEE